LELNLPKRAIHSGGSFWGLFLDIGKADNLVIYRILAASIKQSLHDSQPMRSEASALDEQGLNA
jgi:hypothetical protein